jgi:hypothetical protein
VYKIIKKIISNNKIIGIIAIDSTGKSVNVRKENLHNYQFINAKITSDNKIISGNQIDSINVEELSRRKVENKIEIEPKIITVYHGSPNTSINPEHGKGQDKHDYGNGFYLTENKELAKEWAACLKATTQGYVHTFTLDLTDLKIFNFNEHSELAWLAEIMSHRDADDSARYRRLAPKFIKKFKVDLPESEYDVIYGWRADASYFSIGKRFVRNEIDYTLIGELFHLGGLENQICLKSKKAFKMLKFVKVEPVDTLYYRSEYNKRNNIAKAKTDRIIESPRNTLELTFDYVLREL